MTPMETRRPPDAWTILENVGWMIDHLDEDGLAELRDVPVLELAKHFSVRERGAA
jgi:hypothetical protein